MNVAVKNISDKEIPPFGLLTAPAADTVYSDSPEVEIHVRSLLDNNETGTGTFESDLHYHNRIGINGAGTLTANNGRGHARFDLTMPVVAATETDDIAIGDILIATSDAASLKKLDRGTTGTPGDYTNIFAMFRPLKRKAEKLWIVTRIENPLFVCKATEDADGTPCVAEILQHGDEDSGSIDVAITPAKTITFFAKNSVSTDDQIMVGLVAGALIQIGGGGVSGGGGGDITSGLCGPCAPGFEVGSVEIPGVGFTSTYRAWQNPIPSAEPSLIVAEIDESFQYHPLDGVNPTFECADDPPPEE